MSPFVLSKKCVHSRQETENTCPKWWHTTEKYVKYHSSTPDINFRAIVSL
jgi:hypothetical protein